MIMNWGGQTSDCTAATSTYTLATAEDRAGLLQILTGDLPQDGVMHRLGHSPPWWPTGIIDRTSMPARGPKGNL
jgi:hypothetical protein